MRGFFVCLLFEHLHVKEYRVICHCIVVWNVSLHDGVEHTFLKKRTWQYVSSGPLHSHSTVCDS